MLDITTCTEKTKILIAIQTGIRLEIRKKKSLRMVRALLFFNFYYILKLSLPVRGWRIKARINTVKRDCSLFYKKRNIILTSLDNFALCREFWLYTLTLPSMSSLRRVCLALHWRAWTGIFYSLIWTNFNLEIVIYFLTTVRVDLSKSSFLNLTF